MSKVMLRQEKAVSRVKNVSPGDKFLLLNSKAVRAHYERFKASIMGLNAETTVVLPAA